MRIGVLGTGMVGKAIATKLVACGHDVMMGARKPDNPAAAEWVSSCAGRPGQAQQGSFAQAAQHGEMVFLCAKGEYALDVLTSAGFAQLADTLLVDVTNPLDFSRGMPPTLSIVNGDSLGETIQRTFPDARVVKTLNTVNCDIMVDAGLIPGDHNIFVSGNDADAKARVTRVLVDDFGWGAPNVIDLGDITTARGTEMYLPLWLRLWSSSKRGDFNIHVVFGSDAQAKEPA